MCACRFDKPSVDDLGTETDSAVNQKVFYHRLGTSQEEDPCLFAEPAHPTWLFGASATPDGRWLWLSVSDGCAPANLSFILDLSALPRNDVGALRFADFAPADTSGKAEEVGDKPRLPFKRLAASFAAQWSLVAVDGTRLTLMTNASAPRNRIVAIDAETAPPDALTSGKFREVLPQHKKDILEVCCRACRNTCVQHPAERECWCNCRSADPTATSTNSQPPLLRALLGKRGSTLK